MLASMLASCWHRAGIDAGIGHSDHAEMSALLFQNLYNFYINIENVI